jgi:hypothetical protein
MTQMNRYAIAFLAAGLSAPLMVKADEHANQRYYDKQDFPSLTVAPYARRSIRR